MQLRFIEDSGHGWLEVPKSEVNRLRVAGNISPFSRHDIHKGVAYLEEDCDAPLFLDAAKESGITVALLHCYVDGDCFVRRLPAWRPSNAVRIP